MEQLLKPLTEASLLFAAMFVTTAIGIAIVRKYRDRKAKGMSEASDMISKFRELHSEGGLSDEEFRTIKTKLADTLRTELKTDLPTDLTTEVTTEFNDNSSPAGLC